MRMRKIITAVWTAMMLLSASLCVYGAKKTAKNEGLGIETLRNGGMELKIALNLGGRVVSFKRRNGENILLFKSPLRNGKGVVPKPSHNGYFPMCAGHVIWVGPQKKWWTQQSVNKERARRKAIWPPDPYLCVGEYKILNRSSERMVIQGPPSPVSGLQLTKTYELKNDGKAILSVSAKNISSRVLQWDIWSNTRLPGTAKPFVPLKKYKGRFVLKVSFETKDPESERQLPVKVANNLFSFNPSPDKNNFIQVAKAYIDSKSGVIAAISGDQLFIKRTRYVDAGSIAPDQGGIEIYQKIDPKGGEGILELEFHGPYRTLNPGEIMEFTETWWLIPYHGEKGEAAYSKAVWHAIKAP